MSWASTPKVVLGCIAFAVFWIMAVVPVLPLLPIGRTAGSLLGACLMVVFQVISPKEAFDSIDLPILGLLFGTMVVSVYLERADMFKYLGHALSWHSRGGKDLLCRICILSALCSALFTNDTTCVVLTQFVLQVCRDERLPPQPFLIALASSANIGSSATPIGNPQNLVIAVQSGIEFGKFLGGVAPAMILGLVTNTLLLLVFYWKRLVPSDAKDGEEHKLDKEQGGRHANLEKKSEERRSEELQGDAGDMNSGHKSSCHAQRGEEHQIDIEAGLTGTLSPHVESDVVGGSSITASSIPANVQDGNFRTANVEQQGEPSQPRPSIIAINEILRLEPRGSGRIQHCGHEASLFQWLRKKVWKLSVYFVVVGMLVAFLYGLDLAWTAITTAIVLMVLDFTDASPSLDQVSYSLLVFFSGMFIAVRGFNKTGAPGQLWNAVEPHARINQASGIAILASVVILLSNVASNVPTVLLLGSRVAASAATTQGTSVTRAWLILAWVSTVAGNLTLVGSAANIIVSEQANRMEHFPYNLSFWNHLRFGLPATLIVIAVGLPLIQI